MVKHYTLLLNGGVQRLSRVYASGAADAQPSAQDDLAFRHLRLQAVPANAAVIYVGATSSVSSTDHGGSLDPTQATAVDHIEFGPFTAGGSIKLSDLYVIGTNNDRLAILGVPY